MRIECIYPMDRPDRMAARITALWAAGGADPATADLVGRLMSTRAREAYGDHHGD